jgi:HD-GYP domain-containing protein (c-di-GMP phosphodiesterase class II)
MGLDGEKLEVVRRGALLHDIGKISVPDAVLLKAGALDERDWVHMRGHADGGYRLLAGVPALAAEAELVRSHHERWDGQGYPGGLRGEAIPLGARIFAVADTFDAITSERPYGRARPRDAAIAIITAEAGRQFDPAVGAAFLEVSASDSSVLAVA